MLQFWASHSRMREKHLAIANALRTKTPYINIMGTIHDCVHCMLKTGQLANCFLSLIWCNEVALLKKKGVKQKTQLWDGYFTLQKRQAKVVAGTWAQGSGEGSMASTCLLPRERSYSVNRFVQSAEKPSFRPNWLGKQVSLFPPKSDDFHSLTPSASVLWPVSSRLLQDCTSQHCSS